MDQEREAMFALSTDKAVDITWPSAVCCHAHIPSEEAADVKQNPLEACHVPTSAHTMYTFSAFPNSIY